MALVLPPPPQNPVSNSFEWREWFFALYTKYQNGGSGITFNSLDFSNSNIDNIITRDHNSLTNIQGGDSLNRYHLTQASAALVTGFFNYGQWYSTADQTFTATTATQIAIDTTVANTGMSLSSNTITITAPGTYNITYSIQLANTDTGTTRYAEFWFRKNGTDIVGSASKFNVPSHHGTLDGYTVAVSNLIVTCVAGDTIQLYGAVEVTNVYIEAYVAQTTPYVRPSIPGTILTVQQVT